jgi:large subunit ribosomal protein L9
MAMHIQVVLREDVAKLGKTGEVVKVKPGYARNFLLPRGMAALATEGNLQRIEHERKAAFARAAKLRKSLEAVAATLEGKTVHIARQAGEDGRLFGAVTTREIADALKAMGIEVDRKKLDAPEMRAVGVYDVVAKLGGEVSATFKVDVTRK